MKHSLKNKYRLLYAAFVVIIMFGGMACSVNRSLKPREKPRRVRSISDRRLIQEVTAQYYPYRYLQLKFSAKYKQGKTSYSLKGFLRTTRDSIIWISLYHKTGIPVAKMAFTQDSVFFLNQLKKQYWQYAYKTLFEKTGYSLSYNILQGIFFDEFFVYNNKKKTIRSLRKKMKLYADSGVYVFQSLRERQIKHYVKRNKKNRLILQSFTIDPETKKILKSKLIDAKQNFKVAIDYQNFEAKDSVLFPTLQHIVVTSKTDTIDIAMKLKKLKKKQKPLNYTIKKILPKK